MDIAPFDTNDTDVVKGEYHPLPAVAPTAAAASGCEFGNLESFEAAAVAVSSGVALAALLGIADLLIR